jgi:hypothetical protein
MGNGEELPIPNSQFSAVVRLLNRRSSSVFWKLTGVQAVASGID